MTWQEIVAIAAPIVSMVVGCITLVTFLANRKQKLRDEGKKQAEDDTKLKSYQEKTDASLETIKLQNEALLQSNRTITDKIDGQNVRLSRIEQTVSDAHLAEIPAKLAALEASVKSAHHRIDEIVAPK